MKEVYRIKKGELTIHSLKIPFDFGLVFEDDGVFFFDFYISESYDLDKLMDHKNEIWTHSFTMSALTDKNNELEATVQKTDIVYH